MNPLNYCTLPAAQRLAAKGIVLETDCYHVRIAENQWKVLPAGDICSTDIDKGIAIPAPSMAEVWRELPKTNELITAMSGCLNSSSALRFIIDCTEIFRDVDKMINLLIYVTEQKEKEKI